MPCLRPLGARPLPAVSPLQLCLDLRRIDDGEAVAAVYEQELDWRFATASTPR
ncbi:MAG: hypothetical protein ACREDL_00210 [Bradyrhizobium sp.]